MVTPDQSSGEGAGPATKQELEAEIEELRADLGETVEALSHKLDVKARIKQRAQRTSPVVPVVAGVALAATVAVLVWRRRS
jgi:hypothetical protein